MKKLMSLIFILMILFNCRSYKQKRACIKFIEKKEIIKINNYNQLIEYTGLNNDAIVKSFIVNGELKSKQEIEEMTNLKRYNIFSAILVKMGDPSLLDPIKKDNFIIIKTDKCLKK